MDRSDQLKGIGGWLMLLAIGVWLSPFRTIISLLKVTEGVNPDVLARYYPAFVGEMVLFAILIIMQIIVVVLMMRKSWRFVPMLIAMSLYMLVRPLLDIVWGSTILSAGSGQPFRVFAEAMATPDVIAGWITTTISLCIWMLYVMRSRRVANTFVREINTISPAVEIA